MLNTVSISSSTMGTRTQIKRLKLTSKWSVGVLLSLMVIQLFVIVESLGSSSSRSRDAPPPTHYWSRSRPKSHSYSLRNSHIGPVPHINEIMSEWSSWARWGRCSRSCGGGVRSRTRVCATSYPRVMPGSGVRTSHDHCGGDSVQYEVCGRGQCPPGQSSAVSFRAAQCRHYNNRRVFGRLVNNWVPYNQGGINPCALVCEGEGEGIVYTFGKVTDGTHCKTDANHNGLCVNGRCLRLSCDGRLGGQTQEDMCRVCGGQNDTCTKHIGVFHTDLPSADQSEDISHTTGALHKSFGYYEVTRIPRGATNVHVTDNSRNFLALKMGEKYMLNGDWLIDWPGAVDAGGAAFTYTRAEDDSETLTTIGPVQQDLTLMVLLREHNPGIHYEYWTPNTLPPNNTSVVIGSTLSPLQTVTTISTTTTTKAPARLSTTPRPAIITNINKARKRVRPGSHHPRKKVIGRHYDKWHKTKVSKDSNLESNSVYDFDKEDNYKETKDRKNTKYNKIYKNKNKQKKKKGRKQKVKPNVKNKKKQKTGSKRSGKIPKNCSACIRTKNAKEKFCTSDFVSRMEVMNSELVGGTRRLEVLVHQSYKNTVPLLHKEYLWVENLCLCPQLRPGRTYIIMGKTEQGRGNEVRLVIDERSYIRQFSPKTLSRIVRIRHHEMRNCSPWRRDLRFFKS